MGIFDSGRKNTTTNTTNVDNTSIGLEDVSGTAVVGSNNMITVSDFGAVSAAAGVVRDALGSVDAARGDAISGILDNARSGFQFGARVTADAFDLVKGGLANALEFAGDSREGERAAFTDALLFASDSREGERNAFSGALEFAGVSAKDSLAFAKDLFGANVNLIGETVTGLNTIARQQSTSTDERVQSIATTLLYVVGGIAAAGLLAWAFAKGHS